MVAALVCSCLVPPRPGRVLVPVPPPPRFGFYYHVPHGRIHFFAPRPGVAVVLPPPGAYVEYLPDGCSTIVVAGIPYYYFNGVYLRPHLSGYVVVTAPDRAPAEQTLTAPPASGEPMSRTANSAADTITVNVPNSKGGFTPVRLVKRDDGYVGPQGEFYDGHPTVDQLKALYGN
ncbi:MAG TPA: DUF6515 family protein [Chitinivibrionales bacterium]|nr:DUF6515 family protein [Chitinivibrionales bacterium]